MSVDMKGKPRARDIGSLYLEDGLAALSEGLAGMKADGHEFRRANMTCDKSIVGRQEGDGSAVHWEAGQLLASYVRKVRFLGRSGRVEFDEEGRRKRQDVALSLLGPRGLRRVGLWTGEEGLMTSSDGMGGGAVEAGGDGEGDEGVGKAPVVIATVLSAPYTMERKEAAGGERYEGFAVDLMKKISQIVGFNYTIRLANGYGSVMRNGKWSGMIGEILEGRADMAVADLTISSQREEVVDFSMPFLDLGISILYVAAPSKSVDMFSFLSPLSANVWLLMLAGGLAVSVCINLISRWSPFETEELGSTEGTSPFR